MTASCSSSVVMDIFLIELQILKMNIPFIQYRIIARALLAAIKTQLKVDSILKANRACIYR